MTLCSDTRTKVCTMCQEEKSLDAYSYHRYGKFQRVSRCKPCRRKIASLQPKRNHHKLPDPEQPDDVCVCGSLRISHSPTHPCPEFFERGL